MENIRVLALKPEFYVTKAAIYQGSNMLFLKSIKHDRDTLLSFDKITDQHQFRAEAVMKELVDAEIRIDLIRVVIGRGGLVKPIPSGVYEVNETLKNDLQNSPIGVHSVNLGGLIAADLAEMLPGSKAYIADPVVVDELDDIARVTGIPGVERKSVFHALGQKATARKYAKSLMKNYEDLNLIVVNIGEGISVGAHSKGRVIDVNQAFDGEGPFSLERSGSLPMMDLIDMCYSGNFTKEQMLKKVRSEGGMMAHLGTRSLFEIQDKIDNGDEKARFLMDAMAYQTAKYIGSMVPVLKGEVDAILLTGMVTHDKSFTDLIIERVKGISPVHIFPGECIADWLNMNAMMLIKGEIQPKIYE